ncbi:MAG: hypothetical protein QMD88_05330 [Coprothermobacterota bacterium]|nr:hypothetical protein [Coprothermobacterota bacterium]
MQDLFVPLIEKLQVGEFQNYKNMSIAPLYYDDAQGLEYLTFDEALEAGLLTIREKDQIGVVPELLAINEANLPVLILDGEELIGAKQNRTLNTTILLKEKSKTIIPVSCTERGRWFQVSKSFGNSDFFISSRIREEKVKTVTESLRSKTGFRSDQGSIWGEIDQIAQEANCRPETGAFRDIAREKSEDLKEYLQAFEPLPEQKGLMVQIGGIIVGMEFLSSSKAYFRLYRKILGSYALDALLHLIRDLHRITLPQAFIEEIKKCKVEVFNSVGYGIDYRFSGKRVVGSSLIHAGSLIHTAFFTLRKQRESNFPSAERRRGWREKGFNTESPTLPSLKKRKN